MIWKTRSAAETSPIRKLMLFMHPSLDALHFAAAEPCNKLCISHVSWDIKNSSINSSNVKHQYYINMAIQQKNIKLAYWMFSLPSCTWSRNSKFWSNKHDAHCEPRRHGGTTPPALEKAEYIILINYTKDKIEGYSFSFPFSWLVTF
jgi:hypothetical protein